LFTEVISASKRILALKAFHARETLCANVKNFDAIPGAVDRSLDMLERERLNYEEDFTIAINTLRC
jgi:hypothetical protein